MIIKGTFQSEKYFKHHRQKIINLFAPGEEDLCYIKNKYDEILSHPNSVGIQIRWFGVASDASWWKYLTQYGFDFYQQAMSQFPEDTLFIVSTNNLEFARKNIPEEITNVIFLEGEPHYIDFFLLSMCKHQIISNSTFGWWAAWLNQNPTKKVIVPRFWIDPIWENETPVLDVWPDEWIKIDAKWAKPDGSTSKI